MPRATEEDWGRRVCVWGGVSKGAVVWLELDLIKSSVWGNREILKDTAGSDGKDIGVGVGSGRRLWWG